ncbi:ribbon-helix-helix protein, CopG family [Histophilus somni]|uniref:Ribbon-helix-helix protein, CopG family n=1 Tax=Histophilus somni TaxID=731 RepID=A0A9Q7E580_HISSO|nr:ribbon-helix-helix protein, CopG family [Histophilus somni]ARU64460.1 ribbon-helix-helix protein, CopG family [Histophilus somni]ARU66245.1 ribbon-helix-helix protein, CopG family [Histophilus somni]ARU68121.1 ribbon-helix-helix protein, CopG family [Histophilus somni]ARU70001.1 ribbon-helix-helix protein, CopG family [Histophilus somni]ARU71876.1 ribbon-helix-helix protein, CopG family [Histophilus somni]
MATTNAERVAKSDAKRGIKLKAFKLPLEVIEEIEQISQQMGIPQNQLIIQALECFKQANK